MAAPTFYNKGDQAIYNSGMSFVPQEKYRLGYTAPTSEEKITETFGIPNTNAFTNSGGNGFNQSGNAFGYGSPVSEVNVRTFNPQSNDPTGSVADAQGIYNRSAQALGYGYSPSYTDGSMAGKSLSEIQTMANNQIMDNREQYGAQGQYNSPYDDTVDQSKYTKTIGSFPSRGFFNRMRNKGFNLAENLPYIGLPTKILKSILPKQEDRGPGGGNYGIGGLSDAQKDAYNKLAAAGGLFQGSGGFKTLTGKNFNLSDKQFDKYMSGQKDIYNQMTKDGYEIDDEGNVTFNGKPVDKRLNFQKLKYKESSALFKEKIAEEAAADKAYKEKQAADVITAAANTKNPDGSTAAYNYAGRDNDYGTHTSTKTNKEAQANQDRGRGQKADGGRAGYFFGGRVNYKVGGRVSFKNGGLASIL